ncbi:MAG: LysR substrate-binding domain-containing protein [Cytophagales bacterium]|nr:LysR substrate-binding domain-containing protein [Cytophagales bacterium]
MNIQQLEYVVAVDRFRQFSKAADYCHVTQATLSAMIKKLEEELGIIIFDRKTNPVITTEHGLTVLEHANKILMQLKLLREGVKSAKKTVEGHLKLGIIPTVATTLLSIFLKPVLDKYPLLNLEIHELTSMDIVEKLRVGILDLGILATPIKGQWEIEETILYYESMMVYGVENEREMFIRPEEIDSEIIWLMEEGHCFREQSIKVCNLKKKQNLPKNLNFEANSFETLVNLAEEFGGITLIPELYYQTMSERRKQKTAMFKTPIPVREISMVYYRPFAKLNAVEKISAEIVKRMEGRLLTGGYRPHELSIIGI